MATFKKGDKVKVVNLGMCEYLKGIGATDTGIVNAVTSNYLQLETVEGIRVCITPASVELLPQEVVNDFNTQAEVWEYLLTGGVVESHLKIQYKLIAGSLHLLDYYGNWIPRADDNFSEFITVKKYLAPVKWYANIPATGILSWVWGDFPEEGGKVSLILGYDSKQRYPFLNYNGTRWRNARPATLEEAAVLIYQANT